MKSAVNTLDIDELKTVPDMTKTIATDLKKLSDVVDKDFAKKTVHDQLFSKVNDIDSIKLVKKKLQQKN